MKEVFISYSQADRECAQEMVAHLEGHGVECWIAPRDISPSADWAAEIIDAISAARIMVLVFSASSNQSPQVRREVERAVHKGVSLLPFRIENVAPSKSLEFFLSAQHWLDAFPPPLEPHYQRLLHHLKAQRGAQVTPPASTAQPSGAGAIGAHDCARIQAHLAAYIGPLARLLVKRESARASDTDDLIARLSVELDAPSDRSAFAERCRRTLAAGDRALPKA